MTRADLILLDLDEHPWSTTAQVAERIGAPVRTVRTIVTHLYQRGELRRHPLPPQPRRGAPGHLFALAMNEEAAPSAAERGAA